jgi:predicted nuclease of predicted toxin-antitoxin system
MKLWLDAQLPPLLASWINAPEWGIQAFAVRDVGLQMPAIRTSSVRLGRLGLW